VGFVAVLDDRVVVLVPVLGELVLPGVAVPQVVGHVQVLVVVDGGVVPVLFHCPRLLG
jgi:hypothetical protein